MPDRLNCLPILTYHSIDNSGSPISVAPALFKQQMAWLYQSGWNTIGLEALLHGYKLGTWPARTCVLTFDDGFANFAEYALPVLKLFNFTAHVFVVAGWVGCKNDWPGQPAWAPKLSLMGWDTLREIAAAGMILGAHTLTHPHLRQAKLADAEHEIVEGKRIIEERTGHTVEMFAYPYGEATPAAEAIVAQTYQAGFGTDLAFATLASRPTCFERLDIYYLRYQQIFKSLDRAWVRRYLGIRRRLRYQTSRT